MKICLILCWKLAHKWFKKNLQYKKSFITVCWFIQYKLNGISTGIHFSKYFVVTLFDDGRSDCPCRFLHRITITSTSHLKLSFFVYLFCFVSWKDSNRVLAQEQASLSKIMCSYYLSINLSNFRLYIKNPKTHKKVMYESWLAWKARIYFLSLFKIFI